MNLAEVRRRMLSKISDSGLTAKDAHALGLKPLVTAPAAISIPGCGFTIPYYSLKSGRNGFFRYRYLEPVFVRGKLLRYSQPAKMPPEPYFPKIWPWLQFFKKYTGNERRLFITEGELKADCACKMGFPTIGLGGVWNFKSKTQALIPGLESINWTDSHAYIVYDSDAVSNYQVIQAENALARELLERKAHVYIIRLPKLDPEKKTGLDDYLVAKGEKELDNLIVNTKPWEASRQLHELNEEIVFVHDPGCVLQLDTMQRMSADAFKRSIFANRVWYETAIVVNPKTGASREKTIRKSAAAEWVLWPARGEVVRATYVPGADPILPTREVNTWRGWGVEPSKGNVRPWHKFMELFFIKTDPEDRKWFEQWLAYPLQHPGAKLFSAVVAHSLEQGAGKTLVGHTMQQIYGRNFSEIGEAELLGTFNEWAENKQFVLGEEITGGDKRSSADKLKAVITRNQIRINAKYTPTYVLPDCINYYFTSNHPDSFFLDDADRRYFVHELRCGPLPLEFAKEYDAWFRSKEGAAALFDYFLNLDLAGFNPRAPARETSSKRQMIALGRSDVGAWVAELRENPEQTLHLDEKSEECRFMTTTELFRKFDPMGTGKVTKPGLSRALKTGGFRQVNNGEPIKAEEGAVRLWIVRGDRAAAEKMPLTEVAAIRNKEKKPANDLRAGIKRAKYAQEKK